jgi:hypothetical protein
MYKKSEFTTNRRTSLTIYFSGLIFPYLAISCTFSNIIGAIALAQVIRQNKWLTELQYDENNIGLVGFLNLCSAVCI